MLLPHRLSPGWLSRVEQVSLPEQQGDGIELIGVEFLAEPAAPADVRCQPDVSVRTLLSGHPGTVPGKSWEGAMRTASTCRTVRALSPGASPLSVGLLSVGLLLACVQPVFAGNPGAGTTAGAVPASSQVSPSPGDRGIPMISEAFTTAMTPADNIDSPAAWTTPDGATWLIATAKATDRLVVYDGGTGETLRGVGTTGSGDGQFDRPNGIAVADDLLFVVERDNRRVQVLRLPAFEHVLTFATDDLVKPYGLWVNKGKDGYEVYVTDAYMAGEDADGEDILPPLGDLDRRVKRYAVKHVGDGLTASLAGSFGDTGEQGALRVVESVWGDAANDRLLIAEEDEAYANELKVYDLSGRFTGRTIGRDVFQAQSEGIMLKTCAGGGGWWITTEQGKARTVFHLFDRGTFAHIGAVSGKLVANTDGIWLHETASRRFPQGVLYAVHDDQGVVALDWRDIAAALELPACSAP